MRAEVDWICVADHSGEQLPLLSGATVTMNDNKWAYCRVGATSGHTWRSPDSLTAEELERCGPPASMRTDDVTVE
jgi:hypothetical protein